MSFLSKPNGFLLDYQLTSIEKYSYMSGIKILKK